MKIAVDVRDLRVGWPGAPPLLEHITFDVREGEIFAILGGSGCGKSTLMRYLVGLEEIEGGNVRVAGVPSLGAEAERPSFGVLFQEGALFGSLTVSENVALPLARWTRLPPDAIRSIAHAKLALVGLEGAGKKLPAELSGGMRTRAAIARAMALEPSLLFLDEPSAGLDPVTAAELDELILTLRRGFGLTVILVTHDVGSIVHVVDRCVMLDKDARGIIARGTPAELRASTLDAVRCFFNRLPRGAA
jgi:phospholipid/cholesterol/gamma-HCH transport system ATP-binding protein